ncbi:hypothetical protein J6590_039372 [Homalodisca vitripennis]|nr:hypothetical protein J6590_039372 [Homalodisca vitripennis]
MRLRCRYHLLGSHVEPSLISYWALLYDTFASRGEHIFNYEMRQTSSCLLRGLVAIKQEEDRYPKDETCSRLDNSSGALRNVSELTVWLSSVPTCDNYLTRNNSTAMLGQRRRVT